jgi:ubiquinone/menaquinone biosynthesis C-methylase UbiE
MTTENFQGGWELKYREQAEGFAWSSEPQPGVAEFVNKLSPKALILDVGAGDGRNAAVAQNAGHQVALLDISTTALDLALRNLRPQSVAEPVAVLGTMEEMPLAAGQFEAVICLDALPQALNASRALREIHRVLKPHGKVYLNLFTPQDCAWGEGEQIGPRSWVFKQTLFSFWAANEFDQMCSRLFEVENVKQRRWSDPPHIPFRPYQHEHDALFYELKKF